MFPAFSTAALWRARYKNMAKKRKTIGVITTDIYETYQRNVMRGIQREAAAQGYDVVVFSTFLKAGMWFGYLAAEQNIYNMIQYDRLDGIILMPDHLMEFEGSRKLPEILKKRCRGPVVVLDYQIADFPCVMEEGSGQLRPVLEHLYQEHGITDIACMTGMEEHPHARQRLQSYRDFMEEHGLPVKSDRVFYGDFWYNKGEEVLESLLQSPEGLPQAVCCASDNMGISLYAACRKRGINVPRDLVITGYDSDSGGNVLPHFLTSVVKDSESLGVNAVRRLASLLEGKEIPMTQPQDRLAPGSSCPCGIGWEESQADHLEEQFSQAGFGFYHECNFMMEDGIAMRSLEECLWKIDWYLRFLGDISGYSICLCQDWQGSARDNEKYRREGYSSQMKLIYHRYGENRCVDLQREFPLSEMLPSLWEERAQPAIFYVTPLHFMDRCMGYSAMMFEGESSDIPSYYWDWLRNLCNILESMRRYLNLEKLNESLTEAYLLMERNAVTDELTGLYNRKGFVLYTRQQLELAVREGLELVVLVADLNDLKGINDCYGHMEGDYAIRHAALAIRAFLGQENSLYARGYRTGGDEFAAVLALRISQEELAGRMEALEAYLEEINLRSGKAFRVSVSYGISREDPVHTDLNHLLQRADQLMYRAKQNYKREQKRKT